MADDVSLRARFERFPATVKGAFVVRGEGPDPHQVAFHAARVVRIPAPGTRDVAIDRVTLEVPPHKDLFVPFEFPISDLEPGWYGLEADVEVDGSPRTMPGGRHFCVSWPRSAVRAANLRVDRTVRIGEAAVSLERCQSGAEGLTLRFSIDPPQELVLRLFADRDRLEVVEQEIDPSSGKGAVKAYPLLRSHSTLRIEVAGSPRGKGEDVTLELP